MKRLRVSHCAAGACAAAMFLSGCGGSTPSVTPSSQNLPNSARIVEQIPLQTPALRESARLDISNEHLSSSHVHISEISVGGNVMYLYRTKGVASGRYPGSFKASGGFGTAYCLRRHCAYFNESFDIASRSVHIKGYISFSGLRVPKRYKYKATILDGSQKIHRTGRSEIENLDQNDFSQTLRRL